MLQFLCIFCPFTTESDEPTKWWFSWNKLWFPLPVNQNLICLNLLWTQMTCMLCPAISDFSCGIWGPTLEFVWVRETLIAYGSSSNIPNVPLLGNSFISYMDDTYYRASIPIWMLAFHGGQCPYFGTVLWEQNRHVNSRWYAPYNMIYLPLPALCIPFWEQIFMWLKIYLIVRTRH